MGNSYLKESCVNQLLTKVLVHNRKKLLHCYCIEHFIDFFTLSFINPIQVGGEGAKKAPTASFPPVTSRNVEICPQNILTFSFKPFATLV